MAIQQTIKNPLPNLPELRAEVNTALLLSQLGKHAFCRELGITIGDLQSVLELKDMRLSTYKKVVICLRDYREDKQEKGQR